VLDLQAEARSERARATRGRGRTTHGTVVLPELLAVIGEVVAVVDAGTQPSGRPKMMQVTAEVDLLHEVAADVVELRVT